MPGNARDVIVLADRRFPVRIRIGVPPGGVRPASRNDRVARRELRLRWLGNDTVRDARGVQRCGLDLLLGRYPRERLRYAVVCRVPNSIRL
jgi:hypothetical protein